MASAEQMGLNKTWELSLYELHRTQQEAITDNTEIAVCPRSLHSELMCPICLDMLKKTMTTKECLHRFCSDCIITALRSGNKECPTCRKKLVSKRSLRPDPNFDLLISKIYPSRDEYEAHQVRVLETLNKNNSRAALMFSINEGIKAQSQNRLQRIKKTNNDPEQAQGNSSQDVNSNDTKAPAANNQQNSTVAGAKSDSQSSFNLQSSAMSANEDSNGPKLLKRPKPEVTSSENDSGDSSMDASAGHESATEGEGSADMMTLDEIELVFMPHPTEMTSENSLMRALKDNAVRYIKTTANATVDHLSKYLATRLALDIGSELPERSYNFCIYVSPSQGQFILLTGTHTLRFVNDKYWKINKPLEMYYSCKKT